MFCSFFQMCSSLLLFVQYVAVCCSDQRWCIAPTTINWLRVCRCSTDSSYLQERVMSHICMQHTLIHSNRSYESFNSFVPLTEETTLKIFRSWDLTILWLDLLCDGDSVHTRKKLYENLGTPVKTCLICTGTPCKLVGNFDSRNYFESDLLRLCGVRVWLIY